MALTYSDKTRLALRLVTARFLDDAETTAAEASEALQAARNLMVCQVDQANEKTLKDYAAAQQRLRDAANVLRRLPRSVVTPALDGASKELDHVAEALTDDDGDLRLNSASAAVSPCPGGILNFVLEINKVARDAYQAEGDGSVAWPTFKYKTWLVPADTPSTELTDKHVNGRTQIDKTPRRVIFFIRNHVLLGCELCQLAYVTFHELVCHGYQHLVLGIVSTNAPPDCHWTEGWMDTIAYDMAIQWVIGPAARHQWLPYGGDSAAEHIHDSHRRKHEGPGSAKLRRAARQAYRNLAAAFQQNGIARSPDDARTLARRFSLIANAHPGAGHKRLKRLCTRLQILLHSPSKQYETGSVAQACLDFTRDRDFNKLLKSLGDSPGTNPALKR